MSAANGPLPHQAEPLESLRARYPLAVAEVVDVESVWLGNAAQPGQLRRHVFDFRDGLRLMVSRDAVPGMGVFLHVSASLDPKCVAFADVRAGRLGIADFTKLALDAYHAISGDTRELEFDHLSHMGIPHWKRSEGAAR